MNRSLRALGTELGPEVLAATRAVFDPEQQELASRVHPLASDLSYGPDERNRLDLYRAASSATRPVLLFVHGGGFLSGDKGGQDFWPNAAVGRMAAEAGFLGAVMNYRLAPHHTWPAGGEDVAAAVAWLRDNARAYGGDPERIVLLGTSAGAVHIATWLQLQADAPSQVRGVALLSGLYGYTPLDQRDVLYYGDAEHYEERMPREAITATRLPLFLGCAEFDPPRFQAEFVGLMHDRLTRHGMLPWTHFGSGHNHYSMAMHLGTSDRRLAKEIVAFVEECC